MHACAEKRAKAEHIKNCISDLAETGKNKVVPPNIFST